jgi:hypothetical protein
MGVTFIFIFLYESIKEYRNIKNKYKMDTFKNRYRTNTVRTKRECLSESKDHMNHAAKPKQDK